MVTVFIESEARPSLYREAGFLSDMEDDLTDLHKTSKLSEVYSATVPSVDSAMSSWDGSGFDAGYSSQGRHYEANHNVRYTFFLHTKFFILSGTYLHKPSDILLNTNEWRQAKHRTQTGSNSAGLSHHTMLFDTRFTEDEWDKIPG